VGELPQKIVCKSCKEVLYEGDLLKSPQDVIKKYEGKCPKCKKELKFSTESVDVRPTGGK
jgi:NAD-dependent SIR2 family protein deacetylase